MKRLAILLCCAFLLAAAACGAPKTEDTPATIPAPAASAGEAAAQETDKGGIVVATAEEFAAAVGSDATILLGASRILLCQGEDLDEGNYDDENQPFPLDEYPNLRWHRVFDGWELVVTGVDKLTIRGMTVRDDDAARLLTGPRYAFVLRFEDCKNIAIENVVAGHTDEGSCMGGVFAFENCENVSITGSELYGCGTEGLLLDGTRNFSMSGSSIYECTYYIMTLRNSRDVTFTDCLFRDNREYTLINGAGLKNVVFEGCEFLRNTGQAMFDVAGPKGSITMRNCTFTDNNVPNFFNARAVRFVNCTAEDTVINPK